MSQQMHSDEEQRGYTGTRDYETAYTPTLGEPAESYNRSYTQMPAQKIATNYSTGGKSGPSAGQRLALAIISMIVLLGSLAALSDGAYNIVMIAARLVGVIVVCIAAVAINFIFGFRR
jgi:hypothetical protein